MNRIYRTVWNHARQCMVVASETTRSRSKTSGSRKIIVEAVAGAMLALGAGQANAADQTVSTPLTAYYDITSGDSLTITSNGSVIDNSGLSQWGNVNVRPGSAAGFIYNNGTIGSTNATGGIRLGSVSGGVAAVTGSITNSGTITGTNFAIESFNATVGGNVTNQAAGQMSVSGGYYVIGLNSSTVVGSISNDGQLTNSFGGGVGIRLTAGSRVGGSITNGGAIVSDVVGIDIVTGSTVVGSIVNANTGTINAAIGINLYASGVGGSVSNAGTINSTVDGMRVEESNVGGSFVNSNQITSGADGMALGVGSTLTGDMRNDGMINATGHGMYVWGTSNRINGVTNSGQIDAAKLGIGLEGSTIGSVLNAANGIINAGWSGLYISNSTVTGAITNLGTITSAASSASTAGIYLSNTTVVGGVINSGLIDAGTNGASGIYIEKAAAFSINNAATGRIKGANGIQLGGYTNSSSTYYQSGATVTGGITNSGLIQGTNGSAIRFVGSSMTGDIVNNAGATITGTTASIKLEAGLTGITSSPTRIGSVITGSIINSGLIVSTATVSTSVDGVALSVDYGSLLEGGITNSGTITGGGRTGFFGRGIDVGYFTASTVAGGLVNSGLIAAGWSAVDISRGSQIQGGVNNLSGGRINASGPAISLWSGSAIVGGLTNAGTISGGTLNGPNGFSNAAIYLSSSTISGGVKNSGTIAGGQFGIYADNTSTITGGITNAGVVSSNSSNNSIGYQNAAIGVLAGSTITGGVHNLAGGTITGTHTVTPSKASGIRVNNSSVEDGIFNAGLISTSGRGINIESTSTISGGVLNKTGGVITSSVYQALYIGLTTLTGGVTNQSGATLSGYSGISISSSQVQGGVTNAGLISANGTAGLGIWNSTLSGAIYNSGTISSSSSSNFSAGILLSAAQIANGITNASSGTISGSKYGISVYSGNTVGGIVNAGSISGGNTGIYVKNRADIVIGTLNNTGVISGGVKSLNLTNTANPITVNNTGTLQGDANIGLNILNLNGNGGRVIGNVTGAGGTVNVNGTFTSEGTFDVADFNIAATGLFNMGHGVTVSGTATNDGILNVGTSSQTVTGNYDQTGIYRMGLTGTTAGTYGVLNVTGAATVAGGVDVVISGAPTIADGTTVAGVIHSTGAMTVTPTNITVTDNNLFYNFTAATVSGAGNLDLIIAADANALPNAVAPNNPGATGVAQALQTIYNGGVPAGFQPVFDALATMTPQELNAALIELTPSLQGAAAQAGINALHSMNKIIQSRIESVQGLNSGDDTADQYAWARVFGNWSDQDDHRGVTGFETQTQGLAFGLDKPINDQIRAGGLFTYANTDLQSNLGSSKVDVDTYEVAGYASYNIDPQTDINVQLDVGLNKANSTRRIGFLGTTAKGDFDSFNWHLSGGIGHLFQLSDKTNLTPAVRVDYTHVKTDGYTEKGAGVLNQRVDGSNYEELLLTVDTKLSHKLTDEGLKFVANGSVGYDFINEQAQSSSTFTGGGPTFVTDGLEVSPWIYRGGLGLVKETGNGMEFSARYDAEGRTSGYLNQTASVKVRWAF